jgi:hypothetical protein
MIGFDFADPERGLSGTLRPSGAAVLFDHDDVLAASADAAAQLGDGPDASASLEMDGVAVQLELTRIGEPVSLGGERAGSDAVSEADPDQVSLTRSIAVAFSDGGLLALRAARPQGATDHSDEEVTAVLADPAGELMQVREPLLSTHYDEAGRQVRATLELWPEQETEPRPPLRAAGSIVCGTSLPIGERRLDVAFFRWSMDGRPGLGRYEILSAPADD